MRWVRWLACLLLLVLAAPALARTSGDPYASQQWHLERIGAPEAWRATRGGGAVVAVIDSGIALSHPDLRDRLLRDAAGRVVGRDYVDGDADPQDEHGHGTLVAGVLAATADNGIGVAGSAPEASLMPLRILDEDGDGSGDDLDAAIRWAVDHGADVVALSLEATTGVAGANVGIGTSAPDAAVRYAAERDVAVVAAAGNSGVSITDYARDTPVLLVGATDRDDEQADFSDGGRRDAVVAPGVDIVATWCRAVEGGCDGRGDGDGVYGEASGTSFAAPQVAGVVALLRAEGLSAARAVARVRATARDLGDPGPDRQYGHGLIDAAAALDLPAPFSPPSEPTRQAGVGSPSAVGQDPAVPAAPDERDGAVSPGPGASSLPPPVAQSPTAVPADVSVPEPDRDVTVPAPLAAQPPGRTSVPIGWLQVAAATLIATAGALHVAAAATPSRRRRTSLR